MAVGEGGQEVLVEADSVQLLLVFVEEKVDGEVSVVTPVKVKKIYRQMSSCNISLLHLIHT